jgi:lipoprotein-releasing system permease protein
MIGILKAIGANNWSIRKVFLYNASYLILRGLFWGNLIGIGILLLQQQFGIIKLNPENYYVDRAPVYLNWGYIASLNLLTIGVCFLVLLIPSFIITKISPVKAIRSVKTNWSPMLREIRIATIIFRTPSYKDFHCYQG